MIATSDSFRCQRRCEKDGGACAEICERGSVFVEPWLQHALRTQLRLSRRVRRLSTSFPLLANDLALARLPSSAP